MILVHRHKKNLWDNHYDNGHHKNNRDGLGNNYRDSHSDNRYDNCDDGHDDNRGAMIHYKLRFHNLRVHSDLYCQRSIAIWRYGVQHNRDYNNRCVVGKYYQ